MSLSSPPPSRPPLPDRLPLHRLHPQVPQDQSQPPFMAVFQDYLILGVSYDRAAVRSLVPAELDLPPKVTGFIATGQATGSGWGTDRFANFYLALAVEGLSSPDGTPGNFRPLNIYSPDAARTFRPLYNARMLDGAHSFNRQEDRMQAAITAADGLSVQLTVQLPQGAAPQSAAGVHHYMGLSAEGEITSFHSSYTCDFAPVQVLDLTIRGPDAAGRFPQPEITWATISRTLAVSIGAPRGLPFFPLAETPQAAALTMLLSRIGHAAACIGDDGQILGANAAARAILRPLGTVALVEVAARKAAPATLPRPGLPLPIIAQSFPLDPVLLGQGATLVLLKDPAAPGRRSPDAVLQLLGLTPAEARIAAAVGTGLPPRVAAQRLGLAEHTVRSALKIVFDKLSLSRQAELSRLIARLDSP